METRVLTLFDDEEFFPKEPPKEKPKKEKPTKATTNSISQDLDTAKGEEQSILQKENMQDAGPSIFEEEDIPAIPAEQERLVDDRMPAKEAVIANIIPPVKEEPEPVAASENDIPERLVDDKIPENESVVAYYTSGTDEDAISVRDLMDDEQESADSGNIAEIHAETDEEAQDDDPETIKATIENVNEADKELNQQLLSELIQLDYTALMQKNYAFDLNNATVISKELPNEKTVQVEEDRGEIAEEAEFFEDVTPLPEWNLDKKYYTIGEVAQLFAVNTSHIRFWTNEFKLKPRTTRKGDRLYSPKDIAELRLIHHLVKEKKHTIKGAREKLKAERAGVNNKLDLKDSLLELKNTLLKIREQL